MDGQMVRMGRNSVGLTQQQLAERADVPVRVIQRLELGEIPVLSEDYQERVARVFEESLTDD